jgi:hypothetical protein
MESLMKIVLENPYKNLGYWNKGQTHCHSKLSDGNNTADHLIRCYKEKGYHFIFLTDHNTCSPDQLVPGILQIASGEDGKSDRHHVLALGIDRDRLDKNSDQNLDGICDLPTRPCENIQPRVDYITQTQQAVGILAHPTAGHAPAAYAFTLEELKNTQRYTGIEIFNSDKSQPIWSVFTPYDTNKKNTVSWWDETLRHKNTPVWGFAADDCHNVHATLPPFDVIVPGTDGPHFNRGWLVVNTSMDFSDCRLALENISLFEKTTRNRLDQISTAVKSLLFRNMALFYEQKQAFTTEILNNIKSGNFYAVVRGPKSPALAPSSSDNGPMMEITTYGSTIQVKTDLDTSTIRFVFGNQQQTVAGITRPVFRAIHGKTASYTCDGNEIYVRVEIEQNRPSPGQPNQTETYIAFSQPLFVRRV